MNLDYASEHHRYLIAQISSVEILVSADVSVSFIRPLLLSAFRTSLVKRALLSSFSLLVISVISESE